MTTFVDGTEVGTVDVASTVTTSAPLSGDGSGGSPVTLAAVDVPYPPGTFGDGRDGAVVYSSNTTLAADVRATTVVVNAGVTLKVAGFEISATTSITVAATGIISDDGAAAVTTTPGAARSTACTAGVAGGAGGARLTAGSATAVAIAATSTPEGLGAAGGSGAGTGAGAGGTNGAFTVDATARSPFCGPSPTDFEAITGILQAMTVGCGGGGGNAVSGGVGGAGGGIARLRAPSLVNGGTVRALGGAGSAGTAAGGSGGGGGGGGRIVTVGKRSGAGTWSVAGGAGGAGNGGGSAGAAGATGTDHVF